MRIPAAIAFFACALRLFAQQTVTDQPVDSLPYTPGLDTAAIDKTVDPCEDFYRYACGNWIKDNPIPADQSRWDVYSKLQHENQMYLWGLLLEAGKTDTARSADTQKIGDFFYACMDEAAIEKAGLSPLQRSLRRLSGVKSVRDLPLFLADLHLATYASSILFDFGSNQDYADSSAVIGFADAGGLGLPNRDYYTKTDAHSEEIGQKYLEHVAAMFGLLGDSPAVARTEAADAMRIETALANATLTRVEERDPQKLFHKMTLSQLQALTPSFSWKIYLAALGAPLMAELNVSQPAFYTALETQLRSGSFDAMKAYLRWHIIHANARFLPGPFVKADFDFFSHYLRGVPAMAPRWRRCEQLIDHTLGEALGHVFVDKTFTPETKARALAMTRDIEAAMTSEIEALDWMGPDTKREALLKLQAISNKIGYPDRWRDYSGVRIRRGDFFADVQNAVVFESHRQLRKTGKPVDRGEWELSPPTVNAYYDPQMNDINFPAGVLQPPLFDPKMDDAPNFGNTGATIGHELTHGFDDSGRQFDSKGNLRDWWTESDDKQFQTRAACVSDEYSQFTIVDDLKINGKLTMGEDIADLGGTMLAYIAWKASEQGKDLPIGGMAPDQRFFVGMAQWACGSTRPEQLRADAITSEHSPDQYRINGVVSNMPEFQKAFACKAAQPMVRVNACRVW